MSDVNITVRGGIGAPDVEFKCNLWIPISRKNDEDKRFYFFVQVLKDWEHITGAQWTLMETLLEDESQSPGNEKYYVFTAPNPINGSRVTFFFERKGL